MIIYLFVRFIYSFLYTWDFSLSVCLSVVVVVVVVVVFIVVAFVCLLLLFFVVVVVVVLVLLLLLLFLGGGSHWLLLVTNSLHYIIYDPARKFPVPIFITLFHLFSACSALFSSPFLSAVFIPFCGETRI